MSNLITKTYTVNFARANSLPTHSQPYPQQANLQRPMGILIAGTWTTSLPMLAPSTSSPTLTLLASLAGIGLTMTGALQSNGWKHAPSRPPEAAHLILTALLTLLTLPATRPKSATPNQGLQTSTSSEPPQRSSLTSAPLMQYGQPCLQHPRRKCHRDNLIATKRNRQHWHLQPHCRH